MERSHDFLKVIKALTSPFSAWVDFLYLLQLEEYYVPQYLKYIRVFWWRRHVQEKETIDWTIRAMMTLCFALLFFYGLWLMVFILSFHFVLPVVFFLSHILIPWIVGIAAVMTQPIVAFQKKRLLRKAAHVRRNYLGDVHVVAIAGSYGKTTSKHFLNELLRFTHRVLPTPGNVNTPLGVALWMTQIKNAPDILLVEMDTYGLGELAEMCDFVQPNSFLLVSIGDQHMSRFRDFDALKEALLEPLDYLHQETLGVCVIPDSLKGDELQYPYDMHYAGSDLVYADQPIALPDSAPMSSRLNMAKVLPIVEYFDVPHRIVQDVVSHVGLPERRRNHSMRRGFEIIDDSYNISLQTVHSGLSYGSLYAQGVGKKYGVIIAGIPESDMTEMQVHEKLAVSINKEVDIVVVLDSTYAQHIIRHLEVDYVHDTDIRSEEAAWQHIETAYDVDAVVWHVFSELSDLSYE